MKILVLGGAGFIGINASRHFLSQGHEVAIIDNLSRKGSAYNLKKLREEYDFQFEEEDIRNYEGLKTAIDALGELDGILLLAGQVAVTTSVTDPREDFEINALGTFNVLEAVRELGIKPLIIYSSTNKVYGKMEDVNTVLRNGRYEYENLPEGVNEEQQLEFHSPYGCSKGAGDQYVRDYSRIYGIPTTVFRQSCIYGENQFGIEDQGWVAWFTIATMLNRQITVYGDGNQIRDVLYIGDLVNAYEMAFNNPEKVAGQIYNVGGGVDYTLSLNELLVYLRDYFGKEINPLEGDWRPGDQRVYVSDIRKIQKELGWSPKVGVEEGVARLSRWVEDNKEVILNYVFHIPVTN
jgi:CDP-paratose 2-epimerase